MPLDGHVFGGSVRQRGYDLEWVVFNLGNLVFDVHQKSRVTVRHFFGRMKRFL
jgi:hypothetical protein